MRSLHDSRYLSLVRRLRDARRLAGLTQEEAASAVGRPQSYVSKCEAGERRVDVIELVDFARVYGQPLAYFVAEARGAGGASLSSEAPSAASRRHRNRRRP